MDIEFIATSCELFISTTLRVAAVNIRTIAD